MVMHLLRAYAVKHRFVVILAELSKSALYGLLTEVLQSKQRVMLLIVCSSLSPYTQIQIEIMHIWL